MAFSYKIKIRIIILIGLTFFTLNTYSQPQQNFDSVSFYYKKGIALFTKNKYEEAISDLSSTIKYDSTFYAAYLILGECYFQERQYKNAIDTFNKALKFSRYNNSKMIIYIKIANVYYRQDNHEKSIEYLKKSFNVESEMLDINKIVIKNQLTHTFLLDEYYNQLLINKNTPKGEFEDSSEYLKNFVINIKEYYLEMKNKKDKERYKSR